MSRNLTNLLPQEAVRAFKAQYFVRFATLSAFLIAILVAVHGILLLPTHMLLSSHIEAREGQLKALASSGLSEDETALEEQFATLSISAKHIQALEARRHAINIFTDILNIPDTSISITGFSYASPSGGRDAPTASVSGIAGTRDGLRALQLALEESPFVEAVNLPVSTYAKDIDIPFSMTLTLALP
jgi:Tfp pilus assembly protein PilN